MNPKTLSRFQRLDPGRRQALLRAVEAGELTWREIALEFGCSLALVHAASVMLRALDTGITGHANAGRGGPGN